MALYSLSFSLHGISFLEISSPLIIKLKSSETSTEAAKTLFQNPCYIASTHPRRLMTIHDELLALRKKEKRITSEILEKLQMMEDCKGYLPMGYASLFDYLVRGLHYSEATAYQRQACVRLSREIPELKEKIDEGVLSVTAVTTAYKHIRKKSIQEKRKTLKQMENKSTREVKALFIEPMKPIKVQKTHYQDKVYLRLELSHEQNQKLEKLKALKSHQHDLESLIEKLIDQELERYVILNTNPLSLKTHVKFLSA
jgi:mannitol-1-phosphate/altronate dehydrogenase